MITNIFILNWDSADSTKKCLNSVLKSDDKNYRVILINNFSTNSDSVEIRNIYDSLKDKIEIYLIEDKANLGYAGGNNIGLKFLVTNQLSGNILILNPDILISENTISEMKKALIDDIGIVTVRTLDSHGNIMFDAIKLNGFLQKYIITDLESIYTDYSQGSCMLIRRDVINKIGLFDERFFLYWEEVDFSLRVKECGKKLISITSTCIIRKNNSDSRQPAMFYYSVRNARLIKMKHPNLFSNTAYINYLFKILIITAKFIFKPKLLLLVLSNYFAGIHDSYFNIYFSKPVMPISGNSKSLYQ